MPDKEKDESSKSRPPASLPQGNFTLDVNSNNMPLAWKNFKTSLNIYMIANNLEEEPDFRKVAILLHTIGPDALQIYYSFNVGIKDITYKELLGKFEAYFLPKVNISVERHKLFNRKQGPDEEIETYATQLKNIGLQCNFGSLTDDLLKDVFSWNLNASCAYIREKILLEKPKTFDEAVSIAKTLRNTKAEAKSIENDEINLIRSKRQPRQSSQNHMSSQHHQSNQRQSSQHRQSNQNRQEERRSHQSSHNRQQSQSSHGSKEKCSRCDQVHRARCPALGVTCKICHKPNHFAKCCRSKHVRLIEEDSNDQKITPLPCEHVHHVGTTTTPAPEAPEVAPKRAQPSKTRIITKNNPETSRAKDNSKEDAENTYFIIMIVTSIISAVALILLLVVAIKHGCWINNPRGIPLISPTNPNPFYENVLFRKECQQQIEELEQREYDVVGSENEYVEINNRSSAKSSSA